MTHSQKHIDLSLQTWRQFQQLSRFEALGYDFSKIWTNCEQVVELQFDAMPIEYYEIHTVTLTAITLDYQNRSCASKVLPRLHWSEM